MSNLCKTPRRPGERAWCGAPWLAATLLLLLAAAPSAGQTSGPNPLSEYTSAVARAQPAERIRDSQRVAWSTSGPIRIDALEFVIWEYLRTGNRAHGLTWANELQVADKDNALALAVICDAAQSAPSNNIKVDQLLSDARRGMNSMPQLRRPLGMSESDFAKLRQQSLAMLKAAAGYAELKRNMNLAARNDLRDAVSLDPSRGRDLYSLALADLSGKNPDLKEGYWNLARAVQLSQGTPQGAQIAQYARRRYVNDGGTNAGWDQFLVAAAAANRDLAPRTRVGAPRTSVASAGTQPPPGAVYQPPAAVQAQAKTTTIAKVAVPPLPSTPAPSPADNTSYAHAPIHRHAAASGPISLGILIETSLTQSDSRRAVVGALTDMLRHMTDDDEAFILTYDNHLVFEQDLTTDPKQLDEAMQNIKPQKGAELGDAVAFAAGHLARIAKYPNRVPLVVSDGRNSDSHASPLQTSAVINAAAVRIYCIGMDVNGNDGRYRLQALSSGTGGRSEFISSPSQFRQATKEIAQNMGIDFRF